MAEKIPPHPPRHIQQPPPDDSFEHDLHPQPPAAEGYFPGVPEPGRMGRTLADVKEAYHRFPQFTADELKRIPLMPVGSQLEQGATYIDLAEPVIGEFTAYDEMIASPEHLYVPKKDTGYLLWNQLLGVTNPARLDEGTATPPER